MYQPPAQSDRSFPPPRLGGSADDALPISGKFWLLTLCLFITVMTLWLLLYPFDFQARRISSFLTERRWSQIHRINLVLNLALFVPLGVITGWVWKLMFPRRSMLLVLAVAVDGFLLSAAGEYLQMWLPERTSSLIDLVANVIGCAAGGIVGVVWAPQLTRGWRLLAHWLATHRRGRRAFILLIIVLLIRTAPFDASLETYYLRTKFMYETKPAGLPFSKTKQWLMPAGARRVTAAQQTMAKRELSRAGLNFALFAALAFAVTCAGQEHRAMSGRASQRGGPLDAMALCVLLVVVTEALQLQVRSRLMDATDPVAGVIGVLVGVGLGLMRPRVADGEGASSFAKANG